MLPPFLNSIVNDVDIVLNQVTDDFVVVKTTTLCQVADYDPPSLDLWNADVNLNCVRCCRSIYPAKRNVPNAAWTRGHHVTKMSPQTLIFAVLSPKKYHSFGRDKIFCIGIVFNDRVQKRKSSQLF
jgi:hypothetical protein